MDHQRFSMELVYCVYHLLKDFWTQILFIFYKDYFIMKCYENLVGMCCVQFFTVDLVDLVQFNKSCG